MATPSPRPRLLISLSTIWWPGMDTVAERLLDAVRALDVDVIFYHRPGLDPVRVPRNVELHR